MSRPQRNRKPSAALRFLEQNEEMWEKHQQELDATSAERRKQRKERERAKARAERLAEKEKERARKAKLKARKQSKAKPKARAKKRSGNGGPKRPTTAYFYFVAENRDDVKAENPDADFGTVSRILGNEWRSLTEDERAHFEALAAKDRRRYEREMAALTGGEVPQAAPKSKPKPKPRKKAPAFKPPATYFEYCAEAIGALRDRKGSSYAAIEKFIAANHPSLDFKRHHFRNALKRGVENGSFHKIKASFKLDQSLKKRWQGRK